MASADRTPDADRLAKARQAWTNRGDRRPDFAITPKPGQESVWDYPRPPAIVPDSRHVVVGEPADPVAETTSAYRVLETASPPTFYLPPRDVNLGRLVPGPGQSFCEWKGAATYWSLASNPGIAIAWSVPEPLADFAKLAGWFAFYPGRISCTVDGESVRPQMSDFYGGWITDEIVGPFKGEPGTGHW